MQAGLDSLKWSVNAANETPFEKIMSVSGRLIGEIASAYDISENHLMKIVHHRARDGYITTSRGKGGGMRLARAPDKINTGKPVRLTENDLARVACFQPDLKRCPLTPVCGAYAACWQKRWRLSSAKWTAMRCRT